MTQSPTQTELRELRKRPTVAIILPVLNEANRLSACLENVINDQQPDEIIVVDGGSTDASVSIANAILLSAVSVNSPASRVIQTGRGRAQQMNAGTAAANADVILFLHVDTQLPRNALDQVRTAVERGHAWGRFDVRLSGESWLFRLIERLMNWRSAVTGIVTGDQALFVQRDMFDMFGGYAPIDLMEDIEFSQRLKSVSPPARLRQFGPADPTLGFGHSTSCPARSTGDCRAGRRLGPEFGPIPVHRRRQLTAKRHRRTR